MDIRCSACGAAMTCTPGDCWCEHLPRLEKLEARRGCYCEKCLTALTAAQAREASETPPTATSSI